MISLLVLRNRWLVVLLFVVLAGCSDGPRTYRIPGKLVYADGAPVPGASVVLQATVDDKIVAARGMATLDGQFTLTTFQDGDGVVAGEHQVSISPIPAPDGPKPVQLPVPVEYWDFETSGLATTITPETKEIVITIRRK